MPPPRRPKPALISRPCKAHPPHNCHALAPLARTALRHRLRPCPSRAPHALTSRAPCRRASSPRYLRLAFGFPHHQILLSTDTEVFRIIAFRAILLSLF